MQKKSKIIIICPDGVGVRNYLFSSFVKNLENLNFEIFLFHKLPNSAIKEINEVNNSITNFNELNDFIEPIKIRLIREMLVYARLLKNKKLLKNKTILKFWKPRKKGIKKRSLYFFSEILGFLFSKSYKFILFGDKLFEKSIQKCRQTKFYEKDLLKIKPDLILNLHQRSPLVSPIIIAAKKINIKTATVIFSWDNIPKARLICRYNYYFVWSELMKKDLEKLYPEIKTHQIKITGTPQFEFYFNDKLKIDKNTFFEKYGLDINKKTICFSGDDELTSPFDAIYLKDLCEAIDKIPRKNQPQVLFRRCPVDFSTRYNRILEKYKDFVTVVNPDWRIEKKSDEFKFTSIYPSYNDVKLLVNTCLHSDVVVNLGSTMAHDFATLGKPCLYLNYTPVENNYWSTNTIYQFEHFKSMIGLDAVGYIHDKKEIKEKIKEVIDFPEKIGRDRELWLKKIVQHPLEKNGNKLANRISELVKS